MKIAILTSGILPVPATKGGAVENLTDFYLAYNDKYHLHDITVYSVDDEEAMHHPALQSAVNHYSFVDVRSFGAKIRKNFKHLLKRDEYYHYTIEYYFEQALKHITERDYDMVVIENRPGYGLKFPTKYKAKIVYHIHNDFLNAQTRYAQEIYDRADGIITVSDYIKERVLTIYDLDRKTTVVHNGIIENYMSLRDKVSSFKSQVAGKHRPSPKILMDKQTGSVWYVPGGRSTIGRLIADAGAEYPWQGDDHSGSLPLSFESVLEKGGPCDIWLFRYNSPHAITANELLSEKPAYNQFKAFQKGEIYGCNTATSTFYEDTPFRPDLLLRDFITICYPELGLGEPVYFVKVKNQR